MNALPKLVLALAALTLAGPQPEARSGPIVPLHFWFPVGICMECFEEDLGGGVIMHGCQTVGAGVDEGADSCEIKLDSCTPKGDCSTAIATARSLSLYGAAPPTLSEDPFTNALDLLLHGSTTSSPNLHALSQAVTALQTSGTLGSDGKVRLAGSTASGEFRATGQFVVVRQTSAQRVFRLTKFAGLLEVQELLREPPSSARLLGWGFGPSGTHAWVGIPNAEKGVWTVTKARIARRTKVEEEDNDDVGSLPAALAGVDDVPFGREGMLPLDGDDDVGTLPRFWKDDDDVVTLP